MIVNVGCGNCGQEFDLDPAFKWLDERTSQVVCPGCQARTIQRVHALDKAGYPVCGEFLIVKTFNKITKADAFENVWHHSINGPVIIGRRRKQPSLDQILEKIYEKGRE